MQTARTQFAILNFEKRAVSIKYVFCPSTCSVRVLILGYGFCIRKRGSYVDFSSWVLGNENGDKKL